jgi:hypothetical protein
LGRRNRGRVRRGELQAADRIIIGTPMYNFSIPAVLKAYVDHVVRVGVTVVDNVGQAFKSADELRFASRDIPRVSDVVLPVPTVSS